MRILVNQEEAEERPEELDNFFTWSETCNALLRDPFTDYFLCFYATQNAYLCQARRLFFHPYKFITLSHLAVHKTIRTPGFSYTRKTTPDKVNEQKI